MVLRGCDERLWRYCLVLLVMVVSSNVVTAEQRLRDIDDHVVTRVYAVKKVLQKTCETSKCTTQQAKERVQSYLVGRDEGHEPDAKSQWFDDELIVRQSIAAHRQTAERLKKIRKSGVDVRTNQDAHSKPLSYARHSLLGPTLTGAAPKALPPPTDDEILQLLANQLKGGPPVLHETNRHNVRIVKEKIADYVDPPRVYPMIGKAQLHHAHYKCTIYFDKTTTVAYPVQQKLLEDAVEVLYIDHNHLHINAKDAEETITDGGQTLPSPYYLQDDVQYFPASPEFKLTRTPAK